MKQNFTLIELITSIVVIGILAAIIMLNISDLRLQAEETALAATERELQTAVDRYKLEYGEYPTNPQPTKGKPELVIPELIVPEFIKKKYNQDYLVEVDEKGNVVVKKEGVGEDTNSYETMSCEEATTLGYICIYTPEEFDGMRADLSGKYILMNDINLAQFNSWSPIGTDAAPFAGILNGNGFTVLNFSIIDLAIGAEGADMGLFGVVSHGEIANLTISGSNVQLSSQEDPDVYTGLLVGRIYNDMDSNPSRLPLTIRNIELSGEIAISGVVDDWGSATGALVGYAYTAGALTIDDVLVDVAHSSVVRTGGLFGEIELDENIDGLFIRDIVINGSIESDTDAGGLGVAFWAYSYEWDDIVKVTQIENAVINASVTSIYGNASGFLGDIGAGSGEDALSIRNIQINGDVQAGDWANGFVYCLDMDGYSGSVIENITITGDIRADGDSSYVQASGMFGVAYYYDSEFDTKGEHVIRNIKIDSKLEGPSVYGVTDSLQWGWYGQHLTHSFVELSNVTANLEIVARDYAVAGIGSVDMEKSRGGLFENITINATMRPSTDADPEYPPVFLGFLDTLDSELPYGAMEIRGVDLTLDIETDGDIYGFARSIEQWVNENNPTQQGSMLVEDVTMKGSFVTTSGDIYGMFDTLASPKYHYGTWGDIEDETASIKSGPMTFRDIAVDVALATNTGTVYAFSTPSDLQTHYLMYRVVQVPTQYGYYMGREYDVPATSDDLLFENVKATWDLSGNTGNVRLTR